MHHTTTSTAKHAIVWVAFLVENGFGFELYYEEGDRDAVVVEVTGSFRSQELSHQDHSMLRYHYDRTEYEIYGERA